MNTSQTATPPQPIYKRGCVKLGTKPPTVEELREQKIKYGLARIEAIKRNGIWWAHFTYPNPDILPTNQQGETKHE